MTTSTQPVVRGGAFVLAACDADSTFTPDDFTDEQRMIEESATEFVEREVWPRLADLEVQKEGVNRELLKKAADIGLLGIEIPSAYGGLELDKACAMIVQECLGRYESFGVTHAAHTGIGTQPIYSFGSEALKQQYLPKLADGTLISAYALTEPGSGSDALGARTRATLSEDGKCYVLNGSKMWITNAGFCDMYIAFAKVDGDKFTCFIVDAHAPGVTVGQEEHKMGLKGSSTRALSFENVRVPVENIIGEIGKGHKIAFNALNLGRFKLGAAALGAGVAALKEAVTYARERQQFKQPIANFGAIQYKLAQMMIRLWILKSMNCRTAGLLDTALAAVDRTDIQQVLSAIENYAVECSILKVHGTESLDYVVDEEVQVFGGYGFSAEYPAERRYRDSRVNRIFEGTNEINRLVITTRLLKKATDGELNLVGHLQEARTHIEQAAPPDGAGDWVATLLSRARDVVLYCLGLAHEKYGKALADNQEVIAWLSDQIILLYATESGWLRATKQVRQGRPTHALATDIVNVFASDAVSQWTALARQVLGALLEGDALRQATLQIQTWLSFPPLNTVERRRRIAHWLLNADRIEV